MTIHLNADSPSVNDIPTLHTLQYMTLDEFCRIVGIGVEEAREVLHDSDVSWGGLGYTFAEAGNVCRICCVQVPGALQPDRLVYVG